MRILLLLIPMLLYFTLPVVAQNMPVQRNCGTDGYVQALEKKYPGFKQQYQQADQAVQQALQQQSNAQYLRQASTMSIPVVFHVVYSNATQNISDEQVLSQLAVLNADFRRKNSDAANTPSYFLPFAADTELEFCLATLDPNGEVTNGITRTLTTRSSFSNFNDDVKFTSKGGHDAWDRDQYLNIWICNLGDMVIGYATPPGAPAAIDGVVLDYTTVGAKPHNTFSTPFNLGRTGTHEVGHWLGLRHIWGKGATCDDDDGIADTPNQFGENYSCPSGVVISCNDAPYGDMYQNYMDYTDDACMSLFTQGQGAYMRTVLNTSRAGILKSLACSFAIRADFSTNLDGDTLIVAGGSVQFRDASAGVKPSKYLWEFDGAFPSTSAEENPKVSYPRPGKYKVKLTVSNGGLASTEEKEAYIHVTVDNLVVYPNPSDGFITIEQPARVLVRQVQILNQLGQIVLTTEAQNRQIRLDVRNLPAGVYFLRITSSNGTTFRRVSVVK